MCRCPLAIRSRISHASATARNPATWLAAGITRSRSGERTSPTTRPRLRFFTRTRDRQSLPIAHVRRLISELSIRDREVTCPGIHPANIRPNRQNGCSEGSNSTGLQRPDQRKWNSFVPQSISRAKVAGSKPAGTTIKRQLRGSPFRRADGGTLIQDLRQPPAAAVDSGNAGL